MTETRVLIGWMYDEKVHGAFARSMLNTYAYDPGYIRGHIPLEANANLSGPRNQVVRTFLEQDASHLWLLDSDMRFGPDTLPRLIEADADVISGLCFGQRSDDGELSYFTTMFRITDDEIERIETYPENEVIDVDLVGAACLLIRREVLEKIQTNHPEPWPWFAEEITPEGGYHSEDITFAWRVKQAGFQTKLHTGVKLGHMKPHEVTEKVYLADRHKRRLIGAQNGE